MSDVVAIKLRVKGAVFDVEKEALLRVKHTYFQGLLSGSWSPDADGAYSIDVPAIGFDRILEYLRSGNLFVEGLSDAEEECMYSTMDYFLIPYKRQWHYATYQAIEGISSRHVCELQDGRCCGVYEKDILVFSADTEMTMKGHSNYICRVIQLIDGRVCTCSNDRTIKLWSTNTGLCERTLTGHNDVINCVVQLFDGRVCSGSSDATVKVWSISTGACETTMNNESSVYSVAQLADGRICSGDIDGALSIFLLGSSSTESELSWEAHTCWISTIVCIDSTRICTGSGDRKIKVWNTATGECERNLVGHIDSVSSMVLLQDGRLCSCSHDGTLKLWNFETGECESTLDIKYKCLQVLQLEDGRLLSTQSSGSVVVCS